MPGRCPQPRLMPGAGYTLRGANRTIRSRAGNGPSCPLTGSSCSDKSTPGRESGSKRSGRVQYLKPLFALKIAKNQQPIATELLVSPELHVSFSDRKTIWPALSRQLSTSQEGARSNQVSCCDGILLPRRRFGSEGPQRGPGDEVSLKIERVVDGGMEAEEALGGSS